MNKKPTLVATNKTFMYWLQRTCGGDRAHVAEKYPEELAKTIAFDHDSAIETFHGFDDVFPINDDGAWISDNSEPQHVAEVPAEPTVEDGGDH